MNHFRYLYSIKSESYVTFNLRIAIYHYTACRDHYLLIVGSNKI